MKRPRLLLAVESLEPGRGGICRVARLMARVLAEEQAAGRLGASAIALADRDVDPSLDIHVRPAGGSRGRFVLDVQRAAFTHTHFAYDSASMARAHGIARLLARPYLCWIHGIEVWEEMRADHRRPLDRASVLVSNTGYTRRRAHDLHGGFERATVCALATEEEEDASPAATGSGGAETSVLIVARLDELQYKGHRELIGCWPGVVDRVPGARLIVVGDGPGRAAFERLAAASGVGSSIRFTGFVSEEELERLYREATLFAMPSRGEGFGLVYIEAMRHGLPVIASIHDAAPEVNVDGVTGFNVDLDRADELRERLVDLLSNPERAAKMGRAGLQRWSERFRYSAFRERFRPIMTEFLELTR